MAILASTDWADFSFVRDRLGLSDSALSKQFATLEEAGYVTSNDRSPTTATGPGRAHRHRPAAFEGHVAALQEVIATAESATS